VAIQEIMQSVLEGDEVRTSELVQVELDAGTDATAILNGALIGAMDEAGQLMSTGEMFIPEILVAADAMKAGLEVLKPHLPAREASMRGVVVIGSVKGDLHDIGKNLVALMLEGAGFDVVDLGVDVAPETFVDVARERGADVVGMSALLVTTMPHMDLGVAQIKEAGLKARVILGGAPLTRSYADKAHADGYASDAPRAVALVKSLMS
jgi:5-methyltetrahydrofolate--homocysteine methyltransferase